jgi:hypothetical protein
VSLRVEPGRRTLQNAGAHQQLLALGHYDDGSERDLTEGARWTVSDKSVAEVDTAGLLKAIGDGQVTVTAVALGRQAQAQFEVRGAAVARTFEFARDIGGIFTKKGCNSTTCHGRVKGRGGLKLSRGALSKDDYEWIVKGGVYQVLTTEVKGTRVPRIDLNNADRAAAASSGADWRRQAIHGRFTGIPGDSAMDSGRRSFSRSLRRTVR